MARSVRLLTVLGALAVLSAGLWSWATRAPNDADGKAGAVPPAPIATPAAPMVPASSSDTTRAAAATAAAPPAPLELEWFEGRLRRRDRLADAGVRTPAHVAKVAAGIRCPDGTFLPLLNGVREAPGLIREPERGPLPDVVALLVDRDGWEWYEHADGSMTTSRPQRLVDQQGHASLQAVTLHVSHLPADGFVPSEPRPQANDR